MHSHLDIEIDGKSLMLPADFGIDIEDQNPLFNENEMFSYPVEIPLEGNRAVLANVDDVNSDLRPVSLEHRPVKIKVDGLPFRSGTAVMQEDEEVADSLSMNVDASTQSFSDLISGLSCRDIPVKDKIKIGEKIGNVKVDVKFDYNVKIKYKGKKGTKIYIDSSGKAFGGCEPQALGFSYPGECVVESELTQVAEASSTRDYPNGNQVVIPQVSRSFINVSDAYGVNGAKYCNARVCYKHVGLNEDGSSSDSTIDIKDCKDQFEDFHPYWVLDANRPQSGICFYVLYFLDCLFAHLGISFDDTALRSIGDFNRLCFFTTHCKYDTEPLYGTKDIPFWKNEKDFDKINAWLTSRGCGGTLKVEDPETKDINSFHYVTVDRNGNRTSANVVVGKNDVESITIKSKVTSLNVSANILSMFANSMNFPDETVSTIIESLENSFGIRFHYDYEQRKVTAYLLRDVFRSNEPPISLSGKVISMVKVSEKITGFRMAYSEESDSKEQRNNLKYGKKDYNTAYDYIDYPKEKTVIDKEYKDFFTNLSATDDKCYIDQKTGNAYRIKVDKDAKNAKELRPTLFEVGQFKGVEIGDCSDINKDFIEERISNFQPIDFSDVNYMAELLHVNPSVIVSYFDKDTKTNATISNFNRKSWKPILAAFVDEEMEHEFVEQHVRNTVSSPFVDLYLTEVLKLVESYDPSGTDNGNSPLQDIDWGLSIAIMRGGGADAEIQAYDYDYDGFGNSKWRTIAGEYALASDSISNMGDDFDYNGTLSGIGNEERFSLKIRAYKQPSWANEPICNIDEIDPKTNKITRKVRSRGLFDTFMSELAHFVVNRKKYKVTLLASAAQIADIPNHWRERFEINGKVGYINKVSYKVSIDKGLSAVEIEFFAL